MSLPALSVNIRLTIAAALHTVDALNAFYQRKQRVASEPSVKA